MTINTFFILTSCRDWLYPQGNLGIRKWTELVERRRKCGKKMRRRTEKKESERKRENEFRRVK